MTSNVRLTGYLVTISGWSLVVASLLYVFSPFAINSDERHHYDTIKARRDHLIEACAALRQQNVSADWRPCEPMYAEMYASDERQYVYCLVSKAACTSWKRTLLVLTGTLDGQRPDELSFRYAHSRGPNDRLLPRFVLFDEDEKRRRLDNYYKFMFVREPLERLVSVYRDKMLRDVDYMRLFVPQILARYRHGAEPGDVTFPEFIRFVLDSWSEGASLDRHWRPQSELCCPCSIKYDFIGHHETLYRDADIVLDRIRAAGGPGSEVEFPRLDPDNRANKSSSLLADYYADISEGDMHKLFVMYELDYTLFGYSHPVL